MQTIYDWLTLAAFSGLVVLFLQRSTADRPVDKIWQYLPPGIGCAASDWFGNHDGGVFAILLLAVSVLYVFYVLKPFPFETRR